MVGLQSMAALGVFIGTSETACATSDQCGAGTPGTYCMVGHTDRGGYCGDDVPLPLETEGACTFEPDRGRRRVHRR